MTFRLALDQNFPLKLVRSIEGAVPLGVELHSIFEIDPRLSDMDDRPLIIALAQLGFDAVATLNYRMLDVPEELGAIVATRIGFVCIRAAGHNPVKATGALLLELSNLPNTFRDRKNHILDLRYEPRRATDGWAYLTKIAEREGISAADLYKRVKPSAVELSGPVFLTDRGPLDKAEWIAPLEGSDIVG